MARGYLTIKEYCKKYGVSRTTVQHWIRHGKLKAATWKRPYMIPDDQPIPVKDPAIHRWRYQWREE